MPEFTAKDVQKLRQASGAGMMDAKRALDESAGDFEEAKNLANNAKIFLISMIANAEN